MSDLAARRKALLDALMPDDELRQLWLRDAAFYNAVNTLVRALPLWVERLADWSKAGQGSQILEMREALTAAMQGHLEDPQAAVDAEHLAWWRSQQ